MYPDVLQNLQPMKLLDFKNYVHLYYVSRNLIPKPVINFVKLNNKRTHSMIYLTLLSLPFKVG